MSHSDLKDHQGLHAGYEPGACPCGCKLKWGSVANSAAKAARRIKGLSSTQNFRPELGTRLDQTGCRTRGGSR